MGNGVIAFLVAISATVWLYTKMQRKTGNNTQSAVVFAALSGVVIFVIMLILLGFIPQG